MKYPLPYAFAREHHWLLEDDGTTQTLLGSSTPAVDTAARTRRLSALTEILRSHEVREIHWEEGETLKQRISAAYAQGESSAAAVVSEVQGDADLSRMMQELPAIEDLLETADDAPIIRMLNALLTQAARDGASDIHIEPYERHSSVRFRVDGTLREVVQPNRALHAALISRLKIMAELDISEKRLPQDGRISLRIGTRAVDVRVSTLPSAHGERAVLRLLDKSESKLSLEAVGMQGDVLERFRQLIGQPQVNARIDLDFAKALRAILRQDPDVIMIGEIRDFETAQIAIQASLTGHLVLATLHTNDAPSAVTRLTDMGVEPFLLSSSLLGVLAQRLVRRLCVHCRRQDDKGMWHPVGCEHCNQSGYKGRTGIYELMVADDKIRSLIHNRAAESKVFVAAEAAGLRSMRADGQRLIEAGITSPEEVMSVTRD